MLLAAACVLLAGLLLLLAYQLWLQSLDSLHEWETMNDEMRMALQQLEQQSKPTSGETPIPVSEPEPKEDENTGRLINLNMATAEQLTSLPGIGATRAKAIVEHRYYNGAFRTTEDIKLVKGIGDKIYENIKDLITVDD